MDLRAKITEAVCDHPRADDQINAVMGVVETRVRELEEENQQLRDTVSAAQKAVDSAGTALAFSPRDWGADHRDAWVYAILLGWGCEDDHEHDDVCEGDAALTEIADQHRWDEATVARVTSHRASITKLDRASARDIAKEEK